MSTIHTKTNHEVCFRGINYSKDQFTNGLMCGDFLRFLVYEKNFLEKGVKPQIHFPST